MNEPLRDTNPGWKRPKHRDCTFPPPHPPERSHPEWMELHVPPARMPTTLWERFFARLFGKRAGR